MATETERNQEQEERNEQFELDFECEQTNNIRAIGDLVNHSLITQGVNYAVKSRARKDFGLVLLYNYENRELGYLPAIYDTINLNGSNQEYKITDRFGANLDTDMSKAGIDKFITFCGSEQFQNEQMDLRDLWLQVKQEIKYYYQFFDERYYSLITAFIIGTYFHDFFSAYPYLWLNGFKKSGKTQLGNLIANLSYCGVAAANMSIASLFRMVQARSPTLFLDEMEQFNNPKDKQDYRSLLNSGYKRMGSDVFRVNNDKNMQLERFRSYCPKVLASINDLDEVLKSRTIPIPCRRNIDPKFNSADREPSADKFTSIRDDLYISRLLFGFRVLEEYQNLSSLEFVEENTPTLNPFEPFDTFEPFEKEGEQAKDTKETKDSKGKKGGILNPFDNQLDGRFWDMIKALLVIAKTYATLEDKQEVKSLLLDINKRIAVDEESNEEFIMLVVLKEIYEQQTEIEKIIDDNGVDLWVELQDLTEAFRIKIGWNNCSWKRVKNYMIQLGFDSAEDQAKHPTTRRRILRIRYEVLKQKLHSLNYDLVPFNEQERKMSNTERIIQTIQENDDCDYNFLLKELSDIQGLKSMLKLLEQDGRIVLVNNVWKVV